MNINIDMKCFFIKLLVLELLIACFISCKKESKKTEVEKVVSEWVGKEVIFPKDINCSFMGKDTICLDMSTPYKILVYTDSVGCMSCKSHLREWNYLLKDIEELGEKQVGFLFYFCPQNEQQIDLLLKRDDFKQIVFVDYTNELNKLNNFPHKAEYRCFLLDKDNKVLLVGNPIMNPNLWKVYKNVIGGKLFKCDSIAETTININQSVIELGDIRIHETTETTFEIKNMGDTPLLISHISSSCGCIVPKWNGSPINSGDKTEVKIKIKPDTLGYFQKTITVYCNITERALKLIVGGMVKQ